MTVIKINAQIINSMLWEIKFVKKKKIKKKKDWEKNTNKFIKMKNIINVKKC